MKLALFALASTLFVIGAGGALPDAAAQGGACTGGADPTDLDCDGTVADLDCDDNDATKPLHPETFEFDNDCDDLAGGSTGIDCDDNDATKPALDADCDGVLTSNDCDDGDPFLPTSIDFDCDGFATIEDCNDNDASIGSRIFDADCDGIPTSDDCNDAEVSIGSRALDADCDGVATSEDCNDNDPSDTRDRSFDTDCDGVDYFFDCDDNDAANTRSNANDADCDGAETSVDCDDNDASKQAAVDCTPVTEPETTTPDPGPSETTTPEPSAVPLVYEPPFGLFVTSGEAAIFDPIPCGGQFTGSIIGGTAPFTLAYTATASSTINLGSFVVTSAGAFAAPAGFIDYSTFPNGNYIVGYSATDASGRTLAGTFAATITDDCGTTPTPSASTPGVIVPVAAPAAPTAAADTPTELALTGATTVALAMVGFALLGGGAHLLGYRRISDDE